MKHDAWCPLLTSILAPDSLCTPLLLSSWHVCTDSQFPAWSRTENVSPRSICASRLTMRRHNGSTRSRLVQLFDESDRKILRLRSHRWSHMELDRHGFPYNVCIILQHEMPLPLRNKTRDNGILMEPGCLSECVSGPSISCTAHNLVMDAQRWFTHGSKPVWYYRSDECTGISAAVFFKLYTQRLHSLYEFMVLSYITHESINLQGYKYRLWSWIWNERTCLIHQIARRKLRHVQ